MHLTMPSLIEGFYITFSGLRIMSLRLTLFPYNVDGMPQEPKSRLRQLACGHADFCYTSFYLQSQNFLTTLGEDLLQYSKPGGFHGLPSLWPPSLRVNAQAWEAVPSLFFPKWRFVFQSLGTTLCRTFCILLTGRSYSRNSS